jgi:hypothetical protein
MKKLDFKHTHTQPLHLIVRNPSRINKIYEGIILALSILFIHGMLKCDNNTKNLPAPTYVNLLQRPNYI